MLQPGSIVDRFVIADRLGEGGMAVVYRVEHQTLGSIHALKVLTVTQGSRKDRLLQEGRVQATLRHPHVVAVTDVLDIGGAPGLLMEYVDGPSMDEWLAKYQPTVDEALVLFRGIVAGVAQAHSRGVIHRDLKPGNVMLQVTDQGVLAKVTDFGLVKLTQEGSRKRTRTGMAMGTPDYMAPEQIRDSSMVDRRADLYSLGVILYELMTGELPFEQTDLVSLFNNITAGRYIPVRGRNPNVPEAVSDVIDALLVADPDHRLMDCASILDILDNRSHQPSTFAMQVENNGLPAPAPIGEIGRTMLSLRTPAADVARSMTRGLAHSESISDLPWQSSAVNSAPTIEQEPPPPPPPQPVAEPDPPGSPIRSVGFAVVGMGGAAFAGGAVVLVAVVLLYLAVGPGPAPDVARVPAQVDEPVPARPVRHDPVAAPVQPAPEPPTPAPATAPDPRPPPEPPAPEPPPAPAPRPVPKPAPAPKPASAPNPTPAAPSPAPPPAPRAGSFTATGTGRVTLTGGGKVYRPGDAVPPGSYPVYVDNNSAGISVKIGAGENRTIDCVAALSRCVVRR